MFYANGKGVEQNYNEAWKWFSKAAESGHPFATQSAKYGRGAPRPATGSPAKK
jgi:TPR repeat protein